MAPSVPTPKTVESQKNEAVVPAAPWMAPFTCRDLRFSPPTPKSAKIKWLEREAKGRNALLAVEFEAADAQRLRGSGLHLDELKATLRDDGKDGDEKANDRVFSALIRFDFNELVQAHASRSAPFRNVAIPVFEGRVKVSETKMPRFDVGKLKPGTIIQISKWGPPIPGPPSPPIEIDHSIMITDTSVVEDPRAGGPCLSGAPMGKWSFGYLMTQIANQPETGIDPSLFVRRWLARWETTQRVNDQQVGARSTMHSQIIIPWENASGGSGAPLNLAKAPFRLLAIVNRIDLRDNFAYGGGGRSAGEARLVFCAVDLRNNCEPLPFTVIFEYGIKKANCTDLKAWGQAWANLSTLDFGLKFNNALEAITEQFVKAGADPTRLPNRSALNQLRTNEVALGFPWQIREFTIDSTSVAGQLAESTVKQTPAPPLNNRKVIADYVNANVPAILADKHIVPARFPGVAPFLGGEAVTSKARQSWDGSQGSIANRSARFHFSLNTCNGCHGGETFGDTRQFSFTHIEPRRAGDPSRLSTFLAGHLSGLPGPDTPVADPVDGVPSRTFNDLARRQEELQRVLSLNCRFPFGELFFSPLRMVH
jgi:hypothetical protein